MSKLDLVKLDSFKEIDIIKIADKVKADIVEGNTKGLPAYVQAKALEKLAKEIIKRIADIAIDESTDYGKDDSVFNGASFTLSKTPLALNFEQDEEYKQLNTALKARKQKLSDAYKQYNKNTALYG